MSGTIIVITILSALFLLYALVNFERNSVYFPASRIRRVPSDAGLGFEDVYFGTKDEIKLNGWFTAHPESRGTILYCHGNAGNLGDRVNMIKILHGLGMNVFVFDYRGYGMSGGRVSEKGTYMDAEAAYDYLTGRKDVEQDKIVIYGRSLGGAVAVDLAVKCSARALIADSTFISMDEMVKEVYPFLYGLRFLMRIKYDNIRKIESISMPKLFIHSTDDEMIPFGHAETLYSAAKDPKELCRVKGSHNEGFMDYEETYIRGIEAFLKKIGL